MLLALDLGTKTGWATEEKRGTARMLRSGTVDLRPRGTRYEGGGMRYLRFRRWLDTMHPAEVVFEEVRRHMSTDAAHVYGGLLATLTAYCEENEVPYRGVPVGTIKKHATGKGNASKDEMIAAARRRGYAPQDDNEADALAILDYAQKSITPEPL